METTAINERPILFNGPMVQAILAGKKTQTRRIIKPQPSHFFDDYNGGWECATNGRCYLCGDESGKPYPSPYEPGMRLWVRETWRLAASCDESLEWANKDHVLYKADSEYNSGTRWRPSIHLPRRFSRITLEIVKVRVERLQDISEADAMAEGCPLTDPQPFVPGYGAASASGWFSDLWESINGPGSWDANPYVRVVEFERIQP